MVQAGSVARGLLVLVAVVAGGLAGGQAGSAVWFALVDVGVVATPACNDVVIDTVNAICARPRSMEVTALATTALCATAAGLVTGHMLRLAGVRPSGRDQAE